MSKTYKILPSTSWADTNISDYSKDSNITRAFSSINLLVILIRNILFLESIT